MTLVLDSGGVSSLATNRVRVTELRRRHGWPALVPAVVLVESLTGDHRRDHAVNRLLRTCVIVGVDEHLGREAARLRTLSGRAGSISAVDAVVAALAVRRPDPVVVTGDAADLAALVSHAGTPVTILSV